MKVKNISAFSLIELSVVILIVGILIGGALQASRLVMAARLSKAVSLTKSSPVNDTKDLMLWYETSLLDSSFLLTENSNGSAISTWKDINPQKTLKNDATQSTSASKPTLVENVINGAIPVIRFDGTDDYLSFNGNEAVNSDYTIFLVEQRRKAGENLIIGGSVPATQSNIFIGYWNDTTFWNSHYAQALAYTSIPAYTSPVVRIHTSWFSQTSGKKYWLNGGDSPESSNASYTTAVSSYSNPSIGRLWNDPYAFFQGDVAEVIFFSRALKNDERQEIEKYLGKKYDIVTG